MGIRLWAKSAIVVVMMLSLVSCGYSKAGRLMASDGENTTPSNSNGEDPCQFNKSNPNPNPFVSGIEQTRCMLENVGKPLKATSDAINAWQRLYEFIASIFRTP